MVQAPQVTLLGHSSDISRVEEHSFPDKAARLPTALAPPHIPIEYFAYCQIYIAREGRDHKGILAQ